MIKYVSILIILFAVIVSAQQNPTPKAYPTVIKLTWDDDTTGTISEYMIFYIQGIDTTKFQTMFNFTNNGTYEDVLGFWIGSSLYNYYYFTAKQMAGISYIRAGVIGIKYDGTTTPLQCIPKVIKNNNAVKIKNVRTE